MTTRQYKMPTALARLEAGLKVRSVDWRPHEYVTAQTGYDFMGNPRLELRDETGARHGPLYDNEIFGAWEDYSDPQTQKPQPATGQGGG